MLAPSAANEEVHTIAPTIPKRMVDKQCGVFDIHIVLLQPVGKLPIRDEQLFHLNETRLYVQKYKTDPFHSPPVCLDSG